MLFFEEILKFFRKNILKLFRTEKLDGNFLILLVYYYSCVFGKLVFIFNVKINVRLNL